MTSVCVGSVASQVKAGLPDQIYIDPEFMSSILPPQLVWMRPFLPYLPPMFLPLTPFCTSEPPAQPSLVNATMAAVLAGADYAAALIAGDLIKDAILNWYWYQVCECTSGTQPTAPTPQAEPSGLVQINPPSLVSPPTVQPCYSFVQAARNTLAAGANTFFIGGPTTDLAGSIAIPTGATTMRATYTRTSAGAVHHTCHFIVRFFNAAGTNLGGDSGDPAINTTLTHTLAVPAGAAAVQFLAADLTPPPDNTDLVSGTLDLYCGGSPGQTQSSCCPPDPIAQGMLTQILNLATLIQRQIVPFGYVPGAVHAGLSGAGNFDIQGILGVKVEATTIPDSIGRGGTPTEYFDMGWLTFGTLDGYPHSVRLERETQFTLPARASVFTNLAYDLPTGVVITISELIREP